jgi:hypothetical protein
MAYFNHAFYKSFLVTDANASTGTATSALTAGQLGIVDASTWETVNTAAAFTEPMYHLVQGSLHAKDNIAGNKFHGGYAESVKSKGINPKYVSKIWGSSCETAVASTVEVEVASDCHPCGSNLFLRLDVKGSPALRFLNHNAYAIGDSAGDSAVGNVPGLCCVAGQDYLDPALALAKMGKMLLLDPITAPFVAEDESVTGLTLGTVVGTGYSTATGVATTTTGSGTGLTVDITVTTGNITAVTVNNPGSGYENGDVITIVQGGGASDDETAVVVATAAGMVITTTAGGTVAYTIDQALGLAGSGNYTPSTDPVADGVTAKLRLKGAYVGTKFGDCSFDTRDFFDKEPVQLVASMLDETGNPCNDCGTVVTTPGKMAQTTGEHVIRQLLLTERYMQSPYNQGNKDSARIREIEGSTEITDAVDRSAYYKTYYVQHNVPRFNNPTGVFDNDQYVYEIFVKCDDTTTQTEVQNILNRLATAASLGTPNYAIDNI